MRRSAWQLLAIAAVLAAANQALAQGRGYSPVAYEESSHLTRNVEAAHSALYSSLEDPAPAPKPAAAKGGKYAGCCGAGYGCCNQGCCGAGYGHAGCCGAGHAGCCAQGCCQSAGCCAQSCCAMSNCCCRAQGWVYGAELLYLKPHNSVGTGLSDLAAGDELTDELGNQFNLDPDFDIGYRVWLGYTRCDGLGWRVTYWGFSTSDAQDFEEDLIAATEIEIEQDWDASYWDVEATFSTNWCGRLDATFSGGVRFVDYDESLAIDIDDGAEEVEVATAFQSIGLTAAVELRYRMSCNLGLYGRARSSIVMDDEDGDVDFDALGIDEEFEFTQKNDVRFIHEIAIGAEYIMPMCCGGYYYIRGGAEMSYWDGFGLNHTAVSFDEAEHAVYGLQNSSSTGFAGFSISAGVQR